MNYTQETRKYFVIFGIYTKYMNSKSTSQVLNYKT